MLGVNTGFALCHEWEHTAMAPDLGFSGHGGRFPGVEAEPCTSVKSHAEGAWELADVGNEREMAWWGTGR